MSIQYLRKTSKQRVCGDTKLPLNGIGTYTKTQFKGLPTRKRTVSRAYGGSLSAEAVRHRILRAFFNEELKVIKSSANASRKAGKRRQGGQGQQRKK